MIGGAVHRRIRRQAGLAGQHDVRTQASSDADGSVDGFFLLTFVDGDMTSQ